MTDEWSLKDCKVYAGRGYFRGDIETLRKKLIEDIKDHYWDTLNNSKELIIKHMEFIIDKRFGV